MYYFKVGPNTNNSAALDSVKSMFSSTNGTNLAEDLLSSGDYTTLANLADACSSILNNQISNDNKTGNLTKEEQERLLNEKLNRMAVSLTNMSSQPVHNVTNVHHLTLWTLHGRCFKVLPAAFPIQLFGIEKVQYSQEFFFSNSSRRRQGMI